MRIAVILPSLKRAAPIVVAQDIVASLVARGCEVDVYYFKEENDTISFACPSFKVNLLKPNDFVSYDIVHSHMLKPDFYLWLNRRRIKAQIVSTLHNEIDLVLKDYYGRIISWLVTPLWLTFLKSMDKVICLSQVAKNTLTIKHNIESSTFIYNGRSAIILEVDHNDEVELLRLKEKYFVLGVIANLSKIKALIKLLGRFRV